jgi:hypothetical protein
VSDVFAGFKLLGDVLSFMQCHYCDRDADVTVEKDGIKVGVCKSHFREQMETLADGDWVERIDENLDIERTE